MHPTKDCRAGTYADAVSNVDRRVHGGQGAGWAMGQTSPDGKPCPKKMIRCCRISAFRIAMTPFSPRVVVKPENLETSLMSENCPNRPQTTRTPAALDRRPRAPPSG